MTVTSYKTPGTTATVDRDGKQAWENTDNAKASDNSYATITEVSKSDYTDWLRLANFGFSALDILSGSTIDGIEVKIEHKTSVSTTLQDSALYLRKTSGQVGDNKASATYWGTSDSEVVYGDGADTWGAGLVDTDIVSSDFGLDLSAYNAAADQVPILSIDCVSIRVYYTIPATTVYTDIVSRFKLIGQNFIDIASRFKLTVLNYKDITSRFVLQIANTAFTDIASRFKIIAQPYIDITSRFKLIAQSYTDIASRFTVAVFNYKDIISRFVLHLSNIVYKDIACRFKLAPVHLILQGRYSNGLAYANFIAVLGRDDDGNPIYGSAKDDTQVAYIGYRFQIALDSNVPESVDDVAAGLLSKLKLEQGKDYIIVPPNCGQELWDVIHVVDSICGVSQKYRISGIDTVYNTLGNESLPRTGYYQVLHIIPA